MPETPAGAPLVVLVHGGFWRTGRSLEATEGLAQALAGDGIASWNVEYLAGQRAGGWRAAVGDVAAALRFSSSLCARNGPDQHKILLVGHSAGAQLAFLAAITPQHRPDTSRSPRSLSGLVSLAGVLDMHGAAELGLGEDAAPEFLGLTPAHDPGAYDEASPLHQLPLHVPQLLIHGRLDTRVPSTMSRHYAEAAAEAGDAVELVELANADHNSLIQPHTPDGQNVRSMIATMLGHR
jgi:acetyl esterase/lipase